MEALDKGEGEGGENPDSRHHPTILITTKQALLGAQPAGGEAHLPNMQ